MKKEYQFVKIRFFMFGLSLLLVLGGAAGFLLRGGFNYGIEFKGGLSLQTRIAPLAFIIKNNGEQGFSLFLDSNNFTVADKTYRLPAYQSISQLTAEISAKHNVEIDFKCDPDLSPTILLAMNHSVKLEPNTELVIHYKLTSEQDIFATIDDVRTALSSLGKASLQTIGSPLNQEYMIQVDVPQEKQKKGESELLIESPQSEMEQQVLRMLKERFGENEVILNRTDFIGEQFARGLTGGSIILIVVAFILITIYISIRFRFVSAIAALAALVHDVLIMCGVIATFSIELNTATIAAILTIIGYSLNDTIVVFDRIRENQALLKDTPMDIVVNKSINQSLSRTIITSLTTLVAVVALYMLGTGSIRDFSLSLIIGIVIGTYSSIFIASPIVLGWQKLIDKGKKQREDRYFGKKSLPTHTEEKKQIEEKAAAESEDKDERTAKAVTRVQRRKATKKKKKKKRKK